MQPRYLGRSPLQVSPICLGTMMFGGATDEQVARRIVDSARDRGINFIDTADVYNSGRAEEIVGRAIARDRDRWVLATKVGNSTGPAANQGGISRKWIIESVDASLSRLGTDYLDILYLHRPFQGQHPAEALRAIADLIRQGKLRYFGMSNHHGWRIAEICLLMDQMGVDRPVASQPVYNLVNRHAEVEQIPAAANFGVGIVPYSPLARGVLTAKYDIDGAPPADSRAGRRDTRIMETEWRRESRDIARHIASHAERKGCTAADFAIAWVLANPLISSVIAGPRTEDQWDGYIRALATDIDAGDEAWVNTLVAPGHSSTHGYLDPSYPVEGRPALLQERSF